MPELKERFSEVDGIDAPDLWAEARRRAAAPEAPPRALEWPPGAARRVAVGALAFAVFAAAVVFAWDLARPDPRPAPGPQPAPAVDLAADLPEGWSELPAPPEVRSGAATSWTGSELVVWGGYEFDGGNEDPDAGGYVFDGQERTWSELPASPLAGRSDPAFAWTGRELLIWGGWDGGFREPPYFGDGAAYDPTARTWRTLAPSPLSARSPFAVWTGEEMIVWGSTDRFNRRRDGAAYDPAVDSWRLIADAPADVTDGSAVWTGREMIVFGAALDGNNHADTPTAMGIAYDPRADTWRELPPSRLSPQAMTASWLGDELIAWDYDEASAAYDPVANTWRDLERVPIPFSECYPDSVAIRGAVLGEFCGRVVLFDPDADRWREITRPELPGWVVEEAAAGSAFLLMAHSLELSETTNRTFDTKMLAYVPPAPGAETASSFVPETGRSGDDARLPLTFPDGIRATLLYPIGLDLASLGVRPSVSYLWREDPPPRFPIVFLHGAEAPVGELVDGSEPVDTVTSDPSIEIWKMAEEYADTRRLPGGHWLRYRLPTWTVLVALEDLDRTTEVAASLSLSETDGGFPVAVASGPIALSNESGEGEGPELALGSTLDPSVFLWPESCSGGSTIEGSYGSACLAGGRISASVYGDPSTVRAIVDGLRIEGYRTPG
jgi:hypothetical protein